MKIQQKHNIKFTENNLGYCVVCNGAEGTLTTECPLTKINYETQVKILTGKVDFKDKNWISLI